MQKENKLEQSSRKTKQHCTLVLVNELKALCSFFMLERKYNDAT
jgi:hypothetical protein